jgi:hypothetical protein
MPRTALAKLQRAEDGLLGTWYWRLCRDSTEYVTRILHFSDTTCVFFYGNSANLHERLQFGRKLYIKTALQLLAIVNCFNKQPANYEAIWIT